MKARIEQKKGRPAVVLSIGMIVKNEEKGLEACLKAMEPLRKAVSNELIIADTGSTDRTVEIAKEYADQVFHFEWCDDFAAARNATLERARGEWYLFLDGDEVLDSDLSELISFFTSGESKKYNSGTLLQRNYEDAGHTAYTDFHMTRLHRLRPDARFVYPIHEMIPPALPIKSFQTVAHHDGYIDTVIDSKSERNRRILLREYEKDPNSFHILWHLADSYDVGREDERKERRKYLRIIIDHPERKNWENVCRCAWVSLVRCATAEDNSQEAMELCRQYFETYSGGTPWVSDMEQHFIYGGLLFNAGEYEQAYRHYIQYQELARLYQRGGLDTLDAIVTSFGSTKPVFFAESFYMAAQCCIRQGDCEKARELLEQADPTPLIEGDKLEKALAVEFLYATESGDASRMGDFYRLITGKGTVVQRGFFQIGFEQIFAGAGRELRESAWSSMAAVDQETAFVWLNRLRVARPEDAGARLEPLLTDPEAAGQPLYSDMLYISLVNCLDVLPVLLPIGQGQAVEYFGQLQRNHPDIAEVICRYMAGGEYLKGDSLLAVYWRMRLAGYTLTARGALGGEEAFQMLGLYLAQVELYGKLLYTPAAFEEENQVLLPEEQRFALKMAETLKTYKEGALPLCLKQLKQCLEQFPGQKEMIELLTDRIQGELEKWEQEQKEFQSLALAIKNQFFAFAEAGKSAEAREILSAYEKVNPQDPELPMMKKQLGFKASDTFVVEGGIIPQ